MEKQNNVKSFLRHTFWISFSLSLFFSVPLFTSPSSADFSTTPTANTYPSASLTTGTRIKASDIQAMRDFINAKRAAAGLAVYPFTDPVLTAGVTLVRAKHFLELGLAVKQIYDVPSPGIPPNIWSQYYQLNLRTRLANITPNGATITTSDINNVVNNPIKASTLLALRDSIDAVGSCGDGTCQNYSGGGPENCTTCPTDCRSGCSAATNPTCGAACGTAGTCNASSRCQTQTCPVAGNPTSGPACNVSYSCVTDIACTCGNSSCDAGETAANCASDCTSCATTLSNNGCTANMPGTTGTQTGSCGGGCTGSVTATCTSGTWTGASGSCAPPAGCNMITAGPCSWPHVSPTGTSTFNCGGGCEGFVTATCDGTNYSIGSQSCVLQICPGSWTNNGCPVTMASTSGAPVSGTCGGGCTGSIVANCTSSGWTDASGGGVKCGATCSDGIMNQDEIGVDCGGVCGACACPPQDMGGGSCPRPLIGGKVGALASVDCGSCTGGTSTYLCSGGPPASWAFSSGFGGVCSPSASCPSTMSDNGCTVNMPATTGSGIFGSCAGPCSGSVIANCSSGVWNRIGGGCAPGIVNECIPTPQCSSCPTSGQAVQNFSGCCAGSTTCMPSCTAYTYVPRSGAKCGGSCTTPGPSTFTCSAGTLCSVRTGTGPSPCYNFGGASFGVCDSAGGICNNSDGICNSPYEDSFNDPACSSNLCTNIPTNATLCPSSNTLTAQASTLFANFSSCAAQNCAYYCSSGQHVVGNACVDYACTGTQASGTSYCPGSTTGLTSDVPYTLVNDVNKCTGAKCQTYCNGGTGKQGSSCEAACSGCSTTWRAGPVPGQCTYGCGGSCGVAGPLSCGATENCTCTPISSCASSCDSYLAPACRTGCF